MAFTDKKITDSDISTYGVQSQPNKLTGSATDNKKAFDNLIDQVVQTKFNALIDELLDSGAAAQIGTSVTGLTATNVAAALLELLTSMQSITQGSVSDGAITTAKLAAAAVTHEKMGTDVVPGDVGIKMGTSTPTTADISEGQIYLKYSVPA